LETGTSTNGILIHSLFKAKLVPTGNYVLRNNRQILDFLKKIKIGGTPLLLQKYGSSPKTQFWEG
jgi:hypothetical protein